MLKTKVTEISTTLIVWRFTDGKPGHDNQSRGLVNALGRLTAVEEYAIDVRSGNGLLNFLLGRFPQGNGLPDPKFIIGAGHATHWPMLAARRARGGKIIVLMRPSLPLGWFDRCIIPLHDRVDEKSNVIITRGVLNTIIPSTEQRPDRGLILVGGISKHYRWDEAVLLKQIAAILKRNSDIHWHITDSRRTPDSTSAALAQLKYENLLFISYKDTSSDWMQTQLAIAATIWVTMDSVSMIYEALTAGGRVGLLELPERKKNRINYGIEILMRESSVIWFSAYQETQNLPSSVPLLNEAGRCAKEILTNDVL